MNGGDRGVVVSQSQLVYRLLIVMKIGRLYNLVDLILIILIIRKDGAELAEKIANTNYHK